VIFIVRTAMSHVLKGDVQETTGYPDELQDAGLNSEGYVRRKQERRSIYDES
jgi:hypothetical protein